MNCLTHNRLNEIYCTECSSYLCPECVSVHKSASHKPNYIHVMQYAPTKVVPQIDAMLGSVKDQEKVIESEAAEINGAMERLLPRLKQAVETYNQRVVQLKSLTSQLTTYSRQKYKGSLTEQARASLTSDKQRIETLVKEKKIAPLLRLTQKIDEEAQLAEKQEKVGALVEQLKKSTEQAQDLGVYKAVIAAAGQLSAKCGRLRFSHYTGDWKCDKQYVSSKMSLSEDGLTFGNTSSSGYPAIIGNIDFDSGLYAFEVIPTSLECSGKEGFGIIEKALYLRAYQADNTTPTVYDTMMGFLFKNEAKNMKAESTSDMQMGQKYYVKVNIPELYVTIKGPGLSLRGDLKEGVVYVPCFSCGCTSNKLQIRPLTSFEEDELAAATTGS